MADSIGFEPMHPFRSDSLANCCLNHSANYPKNNRMLFLLIDLCAAITLLAGIEPDHWFGLKLKRLLEASLKLAP